MKLVIVLSLALSAAACGSKSDHEPFTVTDKEILLEKGYKAWPWMKKGKDLPAFEAKVPLLKKTISALPVDDGWLVSFHDNEHGGGLYWFSEDTKKQYKISRHRILHYRIINGSIYAVEGLAHILFSCGAMIRIAFDEKADQWAVKTALRFPLALYACFVER